MKCAASRLECKPPGGMCREYIPAPGPRGQGAAGLRPWSLTVEPFLPPPPPPGAGTGLSCTLPLFDYLQN